MEHSWDLFVLGVKLPTVRAQVLLFSRRYQLASKKISHIWDTYRFCRASVFFSPITNFLTLGISFDPPFSYFLRKLNLKNVAIFLKFKKKSCSWGFAIFLSTECPCMAYPPCRSVWYTLQCRLVWCALQCRVVGCTLRCRLAWCTFQCRLVCHTLHCRSVGCTLHAG